MGTTNREKLAALKDRKANVGRELEALKKKRAIARMNGGKFENTGEIEKLARELDELADAAGMAEEFVAQDDARELALVQAERTEKLLEALDGLREQYLTQVERLQNAALEMSGALSIVHSLAPRLAELGVEISGQRNIPDLQRSNYEYRLLSRIAEVIGDNIWPFRQFLVARVDSEKWLPLWADEERRSLSNILGLSMVKARRRIEQLRLSAATTEAAE